MAESWNRIRNAVDGYPHEIIRLIGESYGPDSVQHAWREFTNDESAQFSGDDLNVELFFSWLFHLWSPMPEKGIEVHDKALYGVSPTRAYLLTGTPSRVDPLLRTYLEACLASRPAFYEVDICKPFIGFQAQDVSTKREIEVSERLASTSLKNGDIVFAYLVSIEDLTLVDAISPLSFPSRIRGPLTKLCRTIRGRELGAVELLSLYFSLLRSHRLFQRFGRDASAPAIKDYRPV